MAKKPPPAISLTHRILSAIDELITFVKSKYWETDSDHYMDEKEFRQLAEMEGRLVALLNKDGRIPFPSNHPSTLRNDGNTFYTPLTGVKYFFIGPGINLDRDDHWEPKMHALRAAVRTIAEEDERTPNKVKGGTLAAAKPTQAETNILVHDWLKTNGRENPRITRDALAEKIGAHAPYVSKAPAWKAFAAKRKANAKPGARAVPWNQRMQASIPAAGQRPDELAAEREKARLILAQEKEETDDAKVEKRRNDS